MVRGWAPGAGAGGGRFAVFFGEARVGLGQGTLRYLHAGGWETIEARANNTVPFDCTFQRLYVRTDAAVPAGESVIVILMVNGVAQTLTCTLTPGILLATDLVNTDALNAGDDFSWRCTASALATTNYMSVAWEIVA